MTQHSAPTKLCHPWQERAAQLAAHEESLDAWKRQFKEQALKQIGDRRRALADWQAKLETQDADIAEHRAVFEVGLVLCLLCTGAQAHAQIGLSRGRWHDFCSCVAEQTVAAIYVEL